MGECKGPPSTRCCFGVLRKREGYAPCRLWAGRAGGTRKVLENGAGLPSQCERVLPDPLTQADSVPACAGPSCQRKGFQDKGGVVRRPLLYPVPAFGKVCLKAGTGPCVPIMKLCSTLHTDSVCEGKSCINAPGPPAGRRIKGKDFKIRGRCTSVSALSGSRLWKKYVPTPGQIFVGEVRPCINHP